MSTSIHNRVMTSLRSCDKQLSAHIDCYCTHNDYLQFECVVSLLHPDRVLPGVSIPRPHQLLVAVKEKPQLTTIGALVEEVTHEVGIWTYVTATVLVEGEEKGGRREGREGGRGREAGRGSRRKEAGGRREGEEEGGRSLRLWSKMVNHIMFILIQAI